MAGGIKTRAARVGAVLLCGAAAVAFAMPPADQVAPSSPPAAAPVRAALSSPPVPILAAAPVERGMVVKRVLTIDGPFTHGDYVWDDDGVPPGPLVITVDLTAQTLSVFRGGYEIGAAVILYGADNKPTPLGVFPITQKNARHVSNLYDVPMPYMMRLTNDGVAIHGSDVKLDSATNGCIGVPTAFAKLLFAQAKLGDKVIITNGERLDVGGRITAI